MNLEPIYDHYSNECSFEENGYSKVYFFVEDKQKVNTMPNDDRLSWGQWGFQRLIKKKDILEK